MKMASSQPKERPPYNGQLDYGEFEYGGHRIGLRLPKEVWGYIRQVGEKDFIWCPEEEEFFEILYPGWIGYIRHQVEVQYGILVFQNSTFAESLLGSREIKEYIPNDYSHTWNV